MDRHNVEAATSARHLAAMRVLADRLAPVASDRRGACHGGGTYLAWFATDAAADEAAILLNDDLTGLRRFRSHGLPALSGAIDFDA